LDNLIDKWIFFIKHAKELSVIPSNVQDKGLQEAYNEANKHNWSKQELEDYEYASMRETDEKATRMLAEERAEARGKIEKSVEIAKELKKNNVGMDIISKATGLTVEEIEKL
jgi:predicted transposase/invertase (TIGR01784 family)